MAIIKHKPSELSDATAIALRNRLQAVEPIARVKVVIPEGGGTISNYCDDTSYFPDYHAVEWGDDFGAFLTSLGLFEVNWGDGNVDMFSYNDGYSGNGFTHTFLEGTYIITCKSPRVFLGSEYVTEILQLTALQYLYLGYCTSLTTPPDLTGLTALQYLNLNGCTSLTTPPDLTGLTALQYLNLNGCTSLTTPPDLTGLTALQTLDLNDCTSLTTPPDLTGLTALQKLYLSGCTSLTSSDLNAMLDFYATLYEAILTVDLRNGVTPDAGKKAAAQAANPQCTFYTD